MTKKSKDLIDGTKSDKGPVYSTIVIITIESPSSV